MNTPSIHRILKSIAATAAVSAVAMATARAVNEREGGEWPWNLKLHGHHDAEVAEALGTGWFLNVGPTGIRARIMRDSPKYFTVKYVFRNSPAHGKIGIGDVIVGANGRRMNTEHYFGRGSRGRSTWDGPMTEMAKLIEDSQGTDGKLEFIVWPGGERSQETTVTVEIKPVGRFSETWPFDCERSEKLLASLRDFLYEDYQRAGRFESTVQTHSMGTLALMGSDVRRHQRLVSTIMASYYDKRYDPVAGAGLPAWGWGYDGIVMGEYYLISGDRRLRPAIESLVETFTYAQSPHAGGYHHKPFPYIYRRVASGGPPGYGPMSFPGGLALTAMGLFREAGLDYGEQPREAVHQAYLRSMNGDGAVGYGFSQGDNVLVESTGPEASVESPRGIGFEIPGGMAAIGEYKVLEDGGEPRWLRTEAETNRVFDMGSGKRRIVRAQTLTAPTRPMRHSGNQIDHFGRSGSGALGHLIGNKGGEGWENVGRFLATACAHSPKTLLDGHASTHIHVLWGSLAAAMAPNPRHFQSYMDGIKWWFIMAQAHDGSYVVMPGRDYASTDHVYGTRVMPSAAAALILSVSERSLMITGRGEATESTDGGRPPRYFDPHKQDMLEKELLFTLADMAHGDEIRPLEMELSMARTKVVFSGVRPDWEIEFRAPNSEQSASFPMEDLEFSDRVMLARLVAAIRRSDPEAQALAGLFCELDGQTTVADLYYERAGEDFAPIIEQIFESD